MPNLAEYIWMDGNDPVQTLRSKTRVVSTDALHPEQYPVWSFDGSSTQQSPGSNSDLLLKPVCVVKDPIRVGRINNNRLVMCEVLKEDGKTPHETNTRARLRSVLDEGASKTKPWFGFEQEYTLYDGARPVGWPQDSKGIPGREQGPYYCGVGYDEVAGRDLVERHLQACLDAGLMIYGVNAEVMLGQWEFQIGHRGFGNETADPLTVSDHLHIARWLLFRLGEEHELTATLHCKPELGNWNGAGCHTNFSTEDMRNPESGRTSIGEAIAKLRPVHDDHIAEYGDGLEARLTGEHETCRINEFRAGPADRGASIRIPRHVEEQGYGYLEDRRPGANCDPYRVCARILKTICA